MGTGPINVEPLDYLLLYMRQNCHLCEDMVEQLEELRTTHGFTVVQRDVDADPLWRKDYGDRVPVLLYKQTVICQYYLDQKALLDLIGTAMSSGQ